MSGATNPPPGTAGSVSTSRYRRADGVFWRNTAQGVLILTGSGEPFTARGAAVDLWHLLADPGTEPELCTLIAARSRQPLNEVAPLVRRMLHELRAIGAVTAT